MYCYKFFANESDAKKFLRSHGGVLYKNTPKSRTKKDYLIYDSMARDAGIDTHDKPYVVTWNGQPV